MAIRKGIVPGANTAQPQTESPRSLGSESSNQRIGRQMPAKAPPPPEPSRILTRDTPREVSEVSVLSSAGLPLGGFRRGLVGADGTPTVMMTADPSQCTELCPRCETMVPPKAMVVMVKNVEQTSNPVKVCASCAQKVFKDPRNEQEKWKPEMPGIRFDQESGKPYKTRERGVGLDYVLNRDTFHSRDEGAKMDRESGVGIDNLNDGHLTGRWSGGGRVGKR